MKSWKKYVAGPPFDFSPAALNSRLDELEGFAHDVLARYGVVRRPGKKSLIKPGASVRFDREALAFTNADLQNALWLELNLLEARRLAGGEVSDQQKAMVLMFELERMAALAKGYQKAEAQAKHPEERGAQARENRASRVKEMQRWVDDHAACKQLKSKLKHAHDTGKLSIKVSRRTYYKYAKKVSFPPKS